ncbi:hypothetical protein [Sabulicella rubraurantiaca]|uniref:hypothetical protein n=1 Tax=Sabulicella rubraurantiaca TaxID=2811429 RepID=UPI001A96845B|nr:hypothetical protein [Sabulicella rubraurantiaca]
MILPDHHAGFALTDEVLDHVSGGAAAEESLAEGLRRAAEQLGKLAARLNLGPHWE